MTVRHLTSGMEAIVAEHIRLLDDGLDIDAYTSRQLADAASCYLNFRPWATDLGPDLRYPEDRRQMTVVAGALYLAAADRVAQGGAEPGAGEQTCRGLAGYCAEVLDRGLLPAGMSR